MSAETHPQTCPACNYQFSADGIANNVFCPACGKRFDVVGNLAETAIIEPPALLDAAATSPLNLNDTVEEIPDLLKSDTVKISKTPENFGDYEIISEIARGGVGVVYRARHKFLNRIVALKVLRAGITATSEDIARFTQEAKAVAALAHPGIVPMHEFNVEHGLYYFTMNYVEGESLDRLLERERLSPYRACEIIETTARAIHYAHTRGIIHRDLKPANVMISADGHPLVTDFGLALDIGNTHLAERMTRSGAVMGTLPYIPPEQAAGKTELITPRSDVYSLGAMFYEMLTGRPPFSGLTQYELLQRVINRSPIEPRKLNPRISRDLQTICLKCLEKEPSSRYLTALALANDCRAFLNGEPISARRQTLTYRFWRLIRRYPVHSALSCLAIILAFTALFARVEVKHAQQELTGVMYEHGQIVEEKRKLDARIERAWRQDFSLRFDDQPNLSADKSVARNRQFCWYNRLVASVKSGVLVMRPLDDHRFSAFGVPVNLPARYQIDCEFTSSSVNAGGYVEFLLYADRDFRADRPYTLSLQIGANGVRLVNNESVIAEKSDFTLISNTKYHVTIAVNAPDGISGDHRRTLNATVNSQPVLTAELPDLSTTVESFVALAGRDAALSLAKFSVNIPGLNQEMISSLLEVADNLAATGEERNLARFLYHRVIQERIPISVLLRVYLGFAKTADVERMPRDELLRTLKPAYEKLTENLQQGRGERNYAGENSYGYGLVLATLHAEREALPFFRAAYHEAENAESNQLLPVRAAWVIASPTISPAKYPAQFDPTQRFSRENEEAGWQYLNLSDGNHFQLPPESYHNDAFKRYVMLTYESEGQPVKLTYPGNSALWVNGAAYPKTKKATPINVALHPGDNYVLLELPANINEFSLLIDGKKEINIFGLLARIDETVATFISGNYTDSLPMFLRLRNENIVSVLREKYPATLQTRNYFNAIMPALDKLLTIASRPPVKLPRSELTLATYVLDLLRQISGNEPLRQRDIARRYDDAAYIYLAAIANSNDKASLLYNAERLLESAQKIARDWYVPRLAHAQFYYQQQDKRTAAYSSFAALRENFRDSVELRQDLAEFLLLADKKDLTTGETIAPEPQLAQIVLDEALLLPKGRTVETLTLYSRAMLALGKKNEAQTYAEESRKIEDSAEIRELLRKIRGQ